MNQKDHRPAADATFTLAITHQISDIERPMKIVLAYSGRLDSSPQSFPSAEEERKRRCGMPHFPPGIWAFASPFAKGRGLS
jgi:hypothetical protein